MKQIKLGELTIDKVVDGEPVALPMQMALPDISVADLEKLKQWYWDDDLSLDPTQAGMQLSVHSFVLRVDGLNILIDTCNGNHKTRSLPFVNNLETPYLAELAKAGLEPKDIDMVMCTHLHADHVGWNTRLEDGRWVPTFPNARYLFSQKDMDFFATQEEEPLHREAYDDSVLPIITAGLADMVDSDTHIHREIGDGIWLEDASGHSPGCLCIHAERGGDRAIFSGDTFHHPILLARPDLPFFADHDAAMASATRQRILAEYANTNAVFFPAHFAGRTAGRVSSVEDGSFQYTYFDQA